MIYSKISDTPKNQINIIMGSARDSIKTRSLLIKESYYKKFQEFVKASVNKFLLFLNKL
jgi:hypothetical protein